MAENPIKVETVGRLSRNLALLHPGATVTLDMSTPAGQRGKFRSQFIGYMPKNYVLVQYPDSSKLGRFSQYIAQGMGVTVHGEKLTLTDDKPVEVIIEDFQGLKNLKLEADICNSKIQADGVMLGVKFSDSSKIEVTKLLQQAVISPH